MSATDDYARKQGVTTATFLLEVDGVDIGRYAQVTGLEVEIEVHTYFEGGQNEHPHRLPGRMVWPNLVFKRGVTSDDHLLEWFHRASGENFATQGKAERSTAAVTLLSSTGERLRAWNLEGAIPVRWSGPTFATAWEDEAMEELEVAHHGFRAETF